MLWFLIEIIYMKRRRSIVWFRNDLRLHDNESILEAVNYSDEVIYAYIFDIRHFQEKTSFGFLKTGIHRARFIIESVAELKAKLKEAGSDLYVRIGYTEQEIFKLANEVKSSWVFCNRERTHEEVLVQNSLEKKLWTIGQELRFFRGKMLLHTADLPFPVTQTPDIFTVFRKEVEKFVEVREPLPVPDRIQPCTHAIDYGTIPTLEALNDSYKGQDGQEGVVFKFKGGESAALARLRYYIWEAKLIQNYKETRNNLLGTDFSSRFSPYLAHGCLSPKTIYDEINKFELQHGANESTYWLYFELLWRDFFRFMGKKHGNKIFQFTGTRGVNSPSTSQDWNLINKWIDGNTGIPFIDANMRELASTGYMSNRGRQNVASFFINDLKQNWLIGAEYFESCLIDYDPCSNYGNWNYLAGVGSDPRQDRYFNTLSQAKRYDPDGSYVKHWIPQLKNRPIAEVHDPLLDDCNTVHEGSIYENLSISI